MIRFIMTFGVFAMASVIVAGVLITIAVSLPDLGLLNLENLWWFVVPGFVIAIPISYVIAGRILKEIRGPSQ